MSEHKINEYISQSGGITSLQQGEGEVYLIRKGKPKSAFVTPMVSDKRCCPIHASTFCRLHSEYIFTALTFHGIPENASDYKNFVFVFFKTGASLTCASGMAPYLLQPME